MNKLSNRNRIMLHAKTKPINNRGKNNIYSQAILYSSC